MRLETLIGSEAARKAAFPVAEAWAFFAHAAVAPLPSAAVRAIGEYCVRGSSGSQENAWTTANVRGARQAAARLLGCAPEEIALLGPTALGLSLVANGLGWQPGDEVVYYQDDYPANVYPWLELRERGVQPVSLRPAQPGVITWDVVEAVLSPRTRLVALASCHFLSGYRIDVDAIGRRLHERGVLFCVDAIQTLGAFPLCVEHVDFLSADSHKWMLGPAGAGIVYVKRSRQELVRPSLLGSWNVVSPKFVALESIRYHEGARRYEPGTLNLPGIVGMTAALELLLEVGVGTVARRILELRRALLERLRPLDYRLYLEAHDLAPDTRDDERSGIVSLTHPRRNLEDLARRLEVGRVSVSLRQNRAGEPFIRFSPHFYNTIEEIDRAVDLMR